MAKLTHQVLRQRLLEGMVIPAHPLALTSDRRLDEKHQKALSRYYLAAGAGGLAVAVHTTQFAVRDPRHGLLEPVLALAADVACEAPVRPVLVAGVCGPTKQAVREAELAASLGYDAALVSLSALRQATDEELVVHCRAVGDVLPVFGFYLQPAVGGRLLSQRFWARLCEIENLVAIKVAPFNRYHTLDVLRGVAASGRAGEIALYTGNDDHIVEDLLLVADVGGQRLCFHGGLLGQWAVGTKAAVELLGRLRSARQAACVPSDLLQIAFQLTDTNSALFDAANSFRGCIAGIHEVLYRQGLMSTNVCLDPEETLSPGQKEEIDRVLAAYPHLHDDAFIAEHRDEWLK